MKLYKFISILCIIMLSGCSFGTSKSNDHSTALDNKEKIPTRVRDMIAQGPGKYSGDKYDEKKVETELDKLDKDASKAEVFNRVVDLVGEDYASVDKAMKNIATDFTFNPNTPGTDVEAPEAKNYNISILLDASGSMAGQVSGGKKMDVAKEAIQTFVSSFPKEANVSLIAYGHKGSNSEKDKQRSCKSIEEIYPLGTYNKSSFNKSLNQVDATGWTPLGSAIKQSGEMLKANSDQKNKNLVYIVSDGLETCGGNPAKEAKALQNDGISAKVNIIGFDVNNSEQQSLKEVAEAGGGTFTSASSKEGLKSYFRGEYNQLILDWYGYNTKVTGEIVEQASKRQSKLYDLSSKAYDIQEQEKDRADKAIEYLRNKGYRQIDTYEYSDKRTGRLFDYFKGMVGNIESKLIENSNKIEEKIDEKSQKNIDDLEDKIED
ncbi:vWA domain-containing protein [Salinithrix halophila]|uniref:VWA domain-containing protein n=1 Tax=Salinithrix halophila TaxID=1485204 RepID=A0ABV8JF97_9BACL